MFARLRLYEKIIILLVLVFFAVIWAFPIVHAFMESLKINGFYNYIVVLNHPKVNYFRTVFNSLFIAACSSLIVTLIASLGAYAFSKLKFKFKNIIYYLLLACLAIPAVAVMTPMFFTIRTLKLMNTYWSIILPLVAFNAPFMLMILKNYFDTIPNSILEAAEIDGCSIFRTYKEIIMPIGFPAIIIVLVLTFIYSWNEFLIPLLFIRKENLYTVTLAAQYFLTTRENSAEMIAQLYAALMLMTIPSILIYLLSQKYLQYGLTAGAIKQ